MCSAENNPLMPCAPFIPHQPLPAALSPSSPPLTGSGSGLPSAFLPNIHREPSELQGVGALEATAWALRMAEHELGITPVLSAKAVVTGSDPLGLIAYLSHFHSAFKSMPHNPGGLGGRWVARGWGRHPLRDSWERHPGLHCSGLFQRSSIDFPSTLTGSVSQGSQGTSSAVLFLGKLHRTLQRTRAQVRSLGRVAAGQCTASGNRWDVGEEVRSGEGRGLRAPMLKV